MRRSGDSGQLGNDAVREDLAMPRVIDVHRVVIERRHRGHYRRHHSHGVGVVMKAVEEPQQRFVDHGVTADAVRERLQLGGLGQVAVEKQIGHFHEAAVFGQLLDRVAAMQQHTGITVDIGDLAFGSRRDAKARVKREHAVIFVDRGDVDDVGADGAAVDGKEGLLAGAQVSELEFLV